MYTRTSATATQLPIFGLSSIGNHTDRRMSRAKPRPDCGPIYLRDRSEIPETTCNRMNRAIRNRKGERDYWLGHYAQYQPGQMRKSSNQAITPADYIGIPIPLNTPTPLASPCLIWRWGLIGSGYGVVGGRYAHVVAYELSRNCQVAQEEGEQVNHLCHRPFCVQPAHLYLGDAKTNAEDRKALRSEMGTYQT